FKFNVTREYKHNVKGCDFHALAKKHKVTSSMVRDWVKNQDKLQQASKDRQVGTRVACRMPGAGRKAQHHDLEERLHSWIVDRNNKGLRVKDKYIRLQALSIYRSQHNDERTTRT
ncbi:hypothetical protein PHYSODRAFT_488094, partial [Phytophthora sojae]